MFQYLFFNSKLQLRLELITDKKRKVVNMYIYTYVIRKVRNWTIFRRFWRALNAKPHTHKQIIKYALALWTWTLCNRKFHLRCKWHYINNIFQSYVLSENVAKNNCIFSRKMEKKCKIYTKYRMEIYFTNYAPKGSNINFNSSETSFYTAPVIVKKLIQTVYVAM